MLILCFPVQKRRPLPGGGGPCSAICFLEVRMAQVKEQNPAPAQNRAGDNSGEKRPRTRRQKCSRYIPAKRPPQPRQPGNGKCLLSDGPHQATLQAFFLISSKKSSLLGNICKEGASPDTRLPSKKTTSSQNGLQNTQSRLENSSSGKVE